MSLGKAGPHPIPGTQPPYRHPDQSRFHLIPETDTRSHEHHPNCWCQPKMTVFGTTDWDVYVHNPLDTRGR